MGESEQQGNCRKPTNNPPPKFRGSVNHGRRECGFYLAKRLSHATFSSSTPRGRFRLASSNESRMERTTSAAETLS